MLGSPFRPPFARFVANFGHQPTRRIGGHPTSSLTFTNDVLPVKVRYFFAVGPTDWRGMYKHNVS